MEKLSDKISLIVACCMIGFVALFALVGTDCVSLILFTTLENEEGITEEEAYFNSCLFQDQDQYQGKPSKCLLILHLSLSIMHVFTSEVLQKLSKQNYFFDVAIITTTTIFIYHLSIV